MKAGRPPDKRHAHCIMRRLCTLDLGRHARLPQPAVMRCCLYPPLLQFIHESQGRGVCGTRVGGGGGHILIHQGASRRELEPPRSPFSPDRIGSGVTLLYEGDPCSYNDDHGDRDRVHCLACVCVCMDDGWMKVGEICMYALHSPFHRSRGKAAEAKEPQSRATDHLVPSSHPLGPFSQNRGKQRPAKTHSR